MWRGLPVTVAARDQVLTHGQSEQGVAVDAAIAGNEELMWSSGHRLAGAIVKVDAGGGESQGTVAYM